MVTLGVSLLVSKLRELTFLYMKGSALKGKIAEHTLFSKNRPPKQGRENIFAELLPLQNYLFSFHLKAVAEKVTCRMIKCNQ